MRACVRACGVCLWCVVCGVCVCVCVCVCVYMCVCVCGVCVCASKTEKSLKGNVPQPKTGDVQKSLGATVSAF